MSSPRRRPRFFQTIALVALVPMLLAGCVFQHPLSRDAIVGTWKVDSEWTTKSFLSEYGGQDGTIEFASDGTFVMRGVPLRASFRKGEPGSDVSVRAGNWSVKPRYGLSMIVSSGGVGGDAGSNPQMERSLRGSLRMTFWIDVDALDRYVLTRRDPDAL